MTQGFSVLLFLIPFWFPRDWHSHYPSFSILWISSLPNNQTFFLTVLTLIYVLQLTPSLLRIEAQNGWGIRTELSSRCTWWRALTSTPLNKVLYISFSERRHLLFTFLCISLFQNFILLHAAAAKSLQLCPTLCDPIDGSPLGSSVPRILQAKILEWVAISFSNFIV